MLGIDCHCHLEYVKDERTDADASKHMESIVEEAQKRMTAVVTSVAHPKDAEFSLALSGKYPKFVHAALGFHPTEVSKFTDGQIGDYMALIRKNRHKIVAIGEVGLDRNWITDDAEHERSKEVFLKFILLANELKLPLVVHSRNGKEKKENSAMQQTLEMLQHATVPVMMHCFSSYDHIKYCSDKKYFLSMNTILCKSKTYSKIAKHVPLDLMVLETDAPWMDPDPSSSGLTNRPWKIEKAAEKIAELKGISKEEVLETTTKNAKRLFGI
ncbi:MAG: TatD family hydrolase [Candidatus Aenigmarchaeota archaeon]|nr:TatD family hydrolase [Candidatus Aenigmarchaeota archaeon]